MFSIPNWIWAVSAAFAALPITILSALSFALFLMGDWPAATSFSLRQGNLAYSGFSKSGDVAFAFSFVMLTVTFGALISWYLRMRSDASNLKAQILVFATPAAFTGVALLFGRATPVFPIEDSSLFPAALMQSAVVVFFLSRSFFRRRAALGESPAESAYGVFLASLAPFAASGVLLSFCFFQPALVERFLKPHVLIGLTGAVAIGLAGVYSTKWAHRYGGIPQGLFVTVLVVASFLPPILNTGSGFVEVSGVRLSAWALALSGIIAAALAEGLIRLRSARISGGVVPLSAAIAAYVVVLRSTFIAPSVPSDNYHFGELFAPTIQWLQWSQVPYVDMYLPRGILQNMVPQWLNGLLNTGQATTLDYVLPPLLFAVVFTAHLVFRSVLGAVAAAFAVLAIGVANFYLEGDLFALTVLAAICVVSVRRLPGGIPGATLGIGSVAAILAYPMMGVIVLAIGGAVMIASFFAPSTTRMRLRYAVLNSVAVVVVTIVVLLTPIHDLIFQAIGYLVSNAGSNTDAFGISYLYSWQNMTGLDWILGTLFIAAVPLSAYLSYRVIYTRREHPHLFLRLAIAAGPGVFALALASRYLGRIDPVGWSGRPTYGTMVVLALVVPLFVALLSDKPLRRLIPFSIAVALVLSFAALPAFAHTNIRSVMGLIEAPDDSLSVAMSTDIPKLGAGTISEEQAEYLSQVARVSSAYGSGEYVLNLTNYGALYGYMNWRMPMRYLAPYNIESDLAEQAAIGQIQHAKPQLALIGPGTWFDGGSLATRAPRLAAWVMNNYSPFVCEGLTWAVSKSASDTTLTSLSSVCSQVASQDDDSLIWQKSIGTPDSIGKSPAYWGASMPPEFIGDAQLLDMAAAMEWVLPAWVAGSKLVLSAHCTDGAPVNPLHPDANGVARIHFVNPSGAELATTAFAFGEGAFIIPLTGFPALKDVPGVSVRLEVYSPGCEAWSIQARGVGF